MNFIDYLNKCPSCGGTLNYRVFDIQDEETQIERQVQYSCNVCQSEGDWRRTTAAAITTLKAKVSA